MERRNEKRKKGEVKTERRAKTLCETQRACQWVAGFVGVVAEKREKVTGGQIALPPLLAAPAVLQPDRQCRA